MHRAASHCTSALLGLFLSVGLVSSSESGSLTPPSLRAPMCSGEVCGLQVRYQNEGLCSAASQIK